VNLMIDLGSTLAVDAESRSGSVTVAGASVQGSVSTRRATGTIGAGVPLVPVTSGSGSIRLQMAGAE
jgi:hypothetical protein